MYWLTCLTRLIDAITPTPVNVPGRTNIVKMLAKRLAESGGSPG